MSIETIEQSSRHSIYVQRFANGLANMYPPYQDQIKTRVNDFLLTYYDLPYNLFLAQLEQLESQIKLDYSNYFQEVTTELEGFSENEVEFQQEQDEKATEEEKEDLTPFFIAGVWGAVISTPMIFESSNTVLLITDVFDNRINGQSKAVRDSLNTSKLTDRTLLQARDDINTILSQKDIARNKTAIATAVKHAEVVSRVETAKKNVAIGYQWISVLDSRTSAICRSLSERIFYFKDKYNPYPPQHPNCRSDIDFVYSKGDPIAERETYYEFLKKQSSKFQDDVLGPTRGKLFRDGGLNAEQFAKLNVDQLFRPITLEEMRKKNPLAFERANLPPKE